MLRRQVHHRRHHRRLPVAARRSSATRRAARPRPTCWKRKSSPGSGCPCLRRAAAGALPRPRFALRPRDDSQGWHVHCVRPPCRSILAGRMRPRLVATRRRCARRHGSSRCRREPARTQIVLALPTPSGNSADRRRPARDRDPVRGRLRGTSGGPDRRPPGRAGGGPPHGLAVGPGLRAAGHSAAERRRRVAGAVARAAPAPAARAMRQFEAGAPDEGARCRRSPDPSHESRRSPGAAARADARARGGAQGGTRTRPSSPAGKSGAWRGI